MLEPGCVIGAAGGCSRPPMKASTLLLFALQTLPVAALVFACGGENENLPPPPPPPPPPPAVSEAPIASAAPSASASTPPPPPAPPVQLVQGTASHDPAAPLPTVKI